MGLLLVGTRAGLYSLRGDADWKRLHLSGPLITRGAVGPLAASEGTLFAAAGRGLYVSRNGLRWKRAGALPKGVRFWSLRSLDGALYAGTEPANVLRSGDGGRSWQEVGKLHAHPSAGEWWGPWQLPLAQAVVADPLDGGRLYAAVSVAGVFARVGEDEDEAGCGWKPVNDGIVPIYPRGARFDAIHRDAQNLACLPPSAGMPEAKSMLLAATSHGIYATGGDGAWQSVSDEWAAHGARALVATAQSCLLYTVPLGDDPSTGRPIVHDQLSVYRSADHARTWQALSAGLPQQAECLVHRDALVAQEMDAWGGPRLYLGTSAGDIYWSPDAGDTWLRITSGLPSIRALLLVSKAAESTEEGWGWRRLGWSFAPRPRR